MKQTELKITPPEGYEIDKENSTIECIVFKKIEDDAITMRDVIKGLHGETLTNIDSCGILGTNCGILTKNIAHLDIAKMTAWAALYDIAKYYNKGWVPKSRDPKYCIQWDAGYKSIVPSGIYYDVDANPYFKNHADVVEVIRNPNFRLILDTLFVPPTKS